MSTQKGTRIWEPTANMTQKEIDQLGKRMRETGMKCPKCGHSLANHGTTGNTKGKCLVPICSCGEDSEHDAQEDLPKFVEDQREMEVGSDHRGEPID